MGIDAGDEVRRGLEKLKANPAEIWCSRFSILEALWTGARFAADGRLDLGLFGQGLNSILKGGVYLIAEEQSEAYLHALQVYSAGHKDMIDNLLYASSRSLGVEAAERRRQAAIFHSIQRVRGHAVVSLGDVMNRSDRPTLQLGKIYFDPGRGARQAGVA